jgi:hypothetical protein
VDILDESDELLKHKFQLVYAWGAQCMLPSLHQRVRMVQHLLQVLCKDSDVRDVLSYNCNSEQMHPDGAIETASVALTKEAERLGCLPSVRLIPGTYRLLKCVPANELFDAVQS